MSRGVVYLVRTAGPGTRLTRREGVYVTTINLYLNLDKLAPWVGHRSLATAFATRDLAEAAALEAATKSPEHIGKLEVIRFNRKSGTWRRLTPE